MQILILLLSLQTLTYQLPKICSSISTSTHNQDTPDTPQQQLQKTKQCFSSLIQNAQYQSIDALEQSLNNQQQKIMQDLISQQIKRLQTISSSIILSRSTCEPVLKWAQNTSHVFLSVKLSHRWDSPPCLRTISQRYELSVSSPQNQTLIFDNLCLVSNSEIRYFFEQRLYNRSKGNLQAKKDGVGTYTLTFEKYEPGLWLYIFANKQKIQIWQEIMDRDESMKRQYENQHKKIEASTQGGAQGGTKASTQAGTQNFIDYLLYLLKGIGRVIYKKAVGLLLF